MIYRPDLHNSQASRKKLKKQLMVETKLSINVKTKSTFKHDYDAKFPNITEIRVTYRLFQKQENG